MQQFPQVIERLGDQISTPAPIVLIDVVDDNIARMQEFADAHGKDLRPHVKTHKCLEIGRMQLEAGAIGLTAGNLSEAEIFAEDGCADIFLAYPLWAGGAKAERLQRLAQETQLSVGAESIAAIDQLAAAMGELVGLLGVVIEVDCGAGRSGVPPEAAGALAAHAQSRGLEPLGVFTYPGHGGRLGAREAAAADQADALRRAVASFANVGLEAHVVSAASTPTAAYSTDPVITEIRPGEYVFNDYDNARLGDCETGQIGLFVASTVVSDQGHRHVIIDAGTKALAREGSPERGFGQVPSFDGVLAKLNEYHGFLELPIGGERPTVGDRIAVVPHHVCPVVNAVEELIITDSSGTFHGRWRVAAQGQLN
ncbi:MULTISPECIES: alanine racemase [unclassified Leucobacter]|uniref:alanine racemase n=1 Tax=unclassified Leucobacter TaxID=2621730 RepID=UPI00165E0B7F|nr:MULTISPECIES: alanine racemase [unclassified Leucobacter]MBC9927020.1 alanine racemase [Leucobacter sp. cx-169]